MKNLEIFDKEGNVLHIIDIIHTFLKDNLSIQLSTNKEYDYNNEYTIIELSVLLGSEEICKSNIFLSH